MKITQAVRIAIEMLRYEAQYISAVHGKAVTVIRLFG